MSDEAYEKIALAVIAGLPAIIAAISSVINGRKLDDARKKLDAKKISLAPRKRSSKRAGGADGNTASDPDWYHPPDL